jgi:flagellar motility protein MotE (MotC chaperone)
MPSFFAPALFAGLLTSVLAHGSVALAQNASAARVSADAAAKAASNDISRFCTNIAPSAEALRIAWQIERLTKLDEQVRQRLADLEKAERETRDWVSKREAMIKSGADSVVAIYAKMQPDTAASQMGAMEDGVAVSILAKLNPRTAGAILEQMDAARASKLSSVLSAAVNPEQKS